MAGRQRHGRHGLQRQLKAAACCSGAAPPGEGGEPCTVRTGTPATTLNSRGVNLWKGGPPDLVGGTHVCGLPCSWSNAGLSVDGEYAPLHTKVTEQQRF